ncbi:radical SAM protein [bacterium]|nr:radical SAM protein [bacterium]MBU1983031.1 radical SAM protein [bacterium]
MAVHDGQPSGPALLRKRLPRLQELLDPCCLCPRTCRARRTKGELGECGIGAGLVISTIGLHHGNEFPISGTRGSGNIFLSGCNLKCVYCQNWPISHEREGRIFSPAQLAEAMLELEKNGAHNINWVSPTHVVPLLIEALLTARESGLRLPVVYNTGGYDSLEVLRLLDGIIDVYLPDMKYGNADCALRYSGVTDYPLHNQSAIREMYRQVGSLQRDAGGVAVRGLLVRHLVLPSDVGNSERILTFLDEELPGLVDVNIMAQYRPCFRAGEFPEIARRPSHDEFAAIVRLTRENSSLRLLEEPAFPR